MGRLSRWMPADEEGSRRVAGRALLALFAPLIALMVVVTAPFAIVRGRRLARLRKEREGEGICTFARAFDRRTTDPWTIRAVHDELQPYFETRDGPVPLRPSDRLYEDLAIDGDDELDDVAQTIARRTGRPLEGVERNPVLSVETVGDLVRFFAHQPPVQAA